MNLDVRGSLRGIYFHYLGPNNMDHMVSTSEKNLSRTNYFGEKYVFNFEKFMTIHKYQHHILERFLKPTLSVLSKTGSWLIRSRGETLISVLPCTRILSSKMKKVDMSWRWRSWELIMAMIQVIYKWRITTTSENSIIGRVHPRRIK